MRCVSYHIFLNNTYERNKIGRKELKRVENYMRMKYLIKNFH